MPFYNNIMRDDCIIFCCISKLCCHKMLVLLNNNIDIHHLCDNSYYSGGLEKKYSCKIGGFDFLGGMIMIPVMLLSSFLWD